MPLSSLLEIDVPDVILLNLQLNRDKKPTVPEGDSDVEAADEPQPATPPPITVCFRIVDERQSAPVLSSHDGQEGAGTPSGLQPPSFSLPPVAEVDDETAAAEEQTESASMSPVKERKEADDGTEKPAQSGSTPASTPPALTATSALAAYMRGEISLPYFKKVQVELGLAEDGDDAGHAGHPQDVGVVNRKVLREALEALDSGEGNGGGAKNALEADIERSRTSHFYVKLLRSLETNHPRAPRMSSGVGAHKGEIFDTQNPVKYFFDDPQTGRCPLTQCWSYLKDRASNPRDDDAVTDPGQGGCWGVSLYTTTSVYPNIVPSEQDDRDFRGRSKNGTDPASDDADVAKDTTNALRYLPSKNDRNGWSSRFNIHDVRFEVVRAITYTQYILNVRCQIPIKTQLWTISNQVYTAGAAVWPNYDVDKPRGGLSKTIRAGPEQGLPRTHSMRTDANLDQDTRGRQDSWSPEHGVVGLRDIKLLSAEWEKNYFNDDAAASLEHRMVQRWYHLKLHFNPTHHFVEFPGSGRIGFKFEHFLTNAQDGAIFKHEHPTKLYFTLICSAGFMAGLGLAHNSVVVIVASMLVSPLMGPIMHSCVGIGLLRSYEQAHGPVATKERFAAKDLIWRGIVAELAGVMICVLCGVVTAAVYLAFDRQYSGIHNFSVTEDWPNIEMSGRGEPWGLLVGFFVALVSAIGVAAATVDASGGIATLIGVGISASLLPPAVNCGMLWVLALWSISEETPVAQVEPRVLFELGGCSLALSLVNITTIFAVVFLVYMGVNTKAGTKAKVHTLTQNALGDDKSMTIGKLHSVRAPITQELFNTYVEPYAETADKLNVGDEQAMRAWFGSPPQTSDGRRRAFEIDASHPLRPNTSASTSSINRERSNESVGAGGGSNDALANIAKMAAAIVGNDKECETSQTMELVDVVYELVQIGLGPEYGRMTAYDSTKMFCSTAEIEDY